jgi:hypothetical protein
MLVYTVGAAALQARCRHVAGNHDLFLETAFATAHPDRELDGHPGKHRGAEGRDLGLGRSSRCGSWGSRIKAMEVPAGRGSLCED